MIRILSEKLIATAHIFHALHDPFIKLYYILLERSLPKFTRIVARWLFYLIINNRPFKFNNCNIFSGLINIFKQNTKLREKTVGMYEKNIMFSSEELCCVKRHR